MDFEIDSVHAPLQSTGQIRKEANKKISSFVRNQPKIIN